MKRSAEYLTLLMLVVQTTMLATRRSEAADPRPNILVIMIEGF